MSYQKFVEEITKTYELINTLNKYCHVLSNDSLGKVLPKQSALKVGTQVNFHEEIYLDVLTQEQLDTIISQICAMMEENKVAAEKRMHELIKNEAAHSVKNKVN